MVIPAIADIVAGNPDWQIFAVGSGVTLFIGVSLSLTSRAGGASLSVRQAFILTTMSWIVLTTFAALPFAFSQLNLSFTDAFFEAMSGITTTGSTPARHRPPFPTPARSIRKRSTDRCWP